MRTAVVPSAWLGLGFGMGARFLIEIASQCDALGVDKYNLDAVRNVGLGLRASSKLRALIERAQSFNDEGISDAHQ